MFSSNLVKKMVASSAVVIALVGGMAVTPVLIAQAQTGTPPTQNRQAAGAPGAGQAPVQGKGLVRVFNLEQRVQDRQSKRLEGTSMVISRTQTLIDKASADGKVVDGLVTALTNYKDAVTKAQTLHTAAGSILDAHAGFTDGKVTDAPAAKTTVTGTGAKQKELAQSLNQARKALVEAVKAFRGSNTK